MSKIKDMTIDAPNKKQTIKYLTELMATVQMAHFKGCELGVTVEEGDGLNPAAINIDLYDFDGTGEDFVEGLNGVTPYHGEDIETETGRVFNIGYDPDDEEPLYFLFLPGDGSDDAYTILPTTLPDDLLHNIVAWLEKAMVPTKQETKPDPKQIKALMDRWAHFCYSHPPYDEVILWMVGGSKQHYLYQHFCSKFLHLCEDVCHDDTMSAWIKFYRELDDQWAERLMEYVYCEWKN